MIELPRPDALHGTALAAELRAAGIDVADDAVTVVGDVLRIGSDADEAAVRAVVDAHVPPEPTPPPPTAGERLDALLAALATATSIAQVREAATTTAQRR